jgi:glc operon protein GlcG
MKNLGISIGVLATVFSFAAGAQTINVMALDQAGAQTVLQAAKENAEQRNAPSAIAVVDPAGDLLAFQRMDGVRPASAELAIEKARTAARLQRSTAEIEDNINQGRTAFVTAGIPAARRHADPCQWRSRGRGRCCRLEQGERRRDREHRGGGAEPSPMTAQRR